MKSLLTTDRITLWHGDAANIATVVAAESVDAIVTDPPAGIGFMGKTWDSDKGGRDHWITWLAGIMRKAMVLLKPGGYALVWALPRTAHWTAIAVEDAGFEICDKVMHLNGQGFPKSIDMARQIDMHLCTSTGRHFDKSLPRGAKLLDGDHLCPAHPARTAGVGYGSGLKPSGEDWILAQKPFRGTYVENFLRWGTGGLRIDDCRLATEEDLNGGAYTPGRALRRMEPLAEDDGRVVAVEFKQPPGRWPANVTLDEQAAVMLDEQAGERRSGSMKAGTPRGENAVFGKLGGAATEEGIVGSTGAASRFFYVAKPTRDEKDAGLDHLPLRTGGEATDREDGTAGLNSPRSGAGRGGGVRNPHPTVKSIALMQWLCRLVTPRGGTVLDLFAGSGTTGLGALAEGLRFVGVETDPVFADVAAGRLAHAACVPTPAPIAGSADDVPAAAPRQKSLFDAIGGGR